MKQQQHSDGTVQAASGFGGSSEQDPAVISKLRNLCNMQWRVAGSMAGLGRRSCEHPSLPKQRNQLDNGFITSLTCCPALHLPDQAVNPTLLATTRRSTS
jgi:hypothetical protein